MRLLFFLALAMMLLTGCGEASDTGASPETTAEASAERESPAEKAKPYNIWRSPWSAHLREGFCY